jgi:hypothetical protein
MKYIKLFEDFSNLNENSKFFINQISQSNYYFKLGMTANGQNLEIKLIAKGGKLKEFIEAHEEQGENCFSDFFEDIQSNSEIQFATNGSYFGLMTEAPCIAYALDRNDDDEFVENNETKIWYYEPYAVSDFVEELITKKSVVFTLAD